MRRRYNQRLSWCPSMASSVTLIALDEPTNQIPQPASSGTNRRTSAAGVELTRLRAATHNPTSEGANLHEQGGSPHSGSEQGLGGNVITATAPVTRSASEQTTMGGRDAAARQTVKARVRFRTRVKNAIMLPYKVFSDSFLANEFSGRRGSAHGYYSVSFN